MPRIVIPIINSGHPQTAGGIPYWHDDANVGRGAEGFAQGFFDVSRAAAFMSDSLAQARDMRRDMEAENTLLDIETRFDEYKKERPMEFEVWENWVAQEGNFHLDKMKEDTTVGGQARMKAFQGRIDGLRRKANAEGIAAEVDKGREEVYGLRRRYYENGKYGEAETLRAQALQKGYLSAADNEKWLAEGPILEETYEAKKLAETDPFEARKKLKEGGYSRLSIEETKNVQMMIDRNISLRQQKNAAEIYYDTAKSGKRLTNGEIEKLETQGRIDKMCAASYLEGNRVAADAKAAAEARFSRERYFKIYNFVRGAPLNVEGVDTEAFMLNVGRHLDASGLDQSLKDRLEGMAMERTDPKSFSRKPLVKEMLARLDEKNKSGEFKKPYELKPGDPALSEQTLRQKQEKDSMEAYLDKRDELIAFMKENPDMKKEDIVRNFFKEGEAKKAADDAQNAMGQMSYPKITVSWTQHASERF